MVSNLPSAPPDTDTRPIRWIHIEEFAGGGGATTAHRMATGKSVDVAVNHKPEAVAMHAMNHPETLHFCQDVWKLDPLTVLEIVAAMHGGAAAVRVAIASGWFSPDCTFFSKAKGGACLDARIRGLCWILLKWCGRGVKRTRNPVGSDQHGRHGRGPACPLVLWMENVEEFKKNGPLIAKRDPATGRVVKRDGSVAAPGERVPRFEQWLVPDLKRAGLYFQRFVRWLRAFGGVVEWRELRACDYGAPTIRKRLFLIVRFDGEPITWPAPTHGDPESEAVRSGKLLRWRTAAECLDLRIQCPSIFMTRKQAEAFRKKTGIKIQRPLVHATCRRVAVGCKRHVIDAPDPYIVVLTHHGSDRTESIHQPAGTLTGAHRGERALVAPFVAHAQHGGATRPATVPAHTFTASEKDQNQVVVAHVVKLRGENVGHAASEPAHTLSAGGNHLGVVASFLAQHNGGEVGHQSYGHQLTEPVSTLSGKGCQQQVVALSLTKYYGNEGNPQIAEPSPTLTAKDRVAITASELAIPPLTPELAKKARRVARFLRRHGVEVPGEFAQVGDLVIWDLGMRMFVAREQYRVQGFPEDYVIDRGVMERDGCTSVVKLTKTIQTELCGNSVCPPQAAAIIAANKPKLAEWREVAA